MEKAQNSTAIFEDPGIGIIILASGRSERFGSPKLLYPFCGRAAIEYVLDTVSTAGLSFCTVVSTRLQAVRELADLRGIRCVLHDGPDLSDSIRAGLSAAPDAAAYIFVQADQLLLSADTLLQMAALWASRKTYIVRAGFRGGPASPVLFPAAYREDLMALTGDRGGSSIIRSKDLPFLLCEVSDPAELRDLDTREDIAFFEDRLSQISMERQEQ